MILQYGTNLYMETSKQTLELSMFITFMPMGVTRSSTLSSFFAAVFALK